MLLILSLELTGPGIRRPGMESGERGTSQITQMVSQATETVSKETNTPAMNRPQP